MDRIMASNSAAKRVKRHKMSPKERVDRISNLPDSIIHHIFSFLSASEVVRTCVLAKRWKYLWTSTPKIYLDDGCFLTVDRKSTFVDFVNGVHRLYDAPKVALYSLVVQEVNNSSFAEEWVQFAVEHNVEELLVDVVGCVPLRAPFCPSVRYMSLNLRGGDLQVSLPSCFSMLESLSLSECKLTSHTAIDLNSDIFPLLRNLTLETCVDLTYLTVTCPNLESLYIKRCSGLDQLVVLGPKLHTLFVEESFPDGSPTSLVNISTPSLRMFTWLDFIIDNFLVGNFKCLVVAYVSLLDYCSDEMKESYVKSARKFLQHLSCAQSLQLEVPCFQALPTNLHLLEGLSTSLNNLKKLSLLAGSNEYAFRTISRLFGCLYNLETLHIHTESDDTDDANASEFQGEERIYHDASLNNLVVVNFCGFGGRHHEMEFVQYLLKNAVKLRKMSIVLSPERSSKRKRHAQVVKKLMKLNKTSSDAIISFGNCMD